MALPREPRTGDVITADWVRACLRWAKTRSAVAFLPPLYAEERPGGEVVVRYAGPDAGDFRIASGSNPYSAVEVQAQAGGGWAVLPGGRTPTVGADPLWERNGNSSVAANTVVRAQRASATSEWIFDRAACSTAPAPAAPRPPTTTNPPANPPPTNPPTNPPATTPPTPPVYVPPEPPREPQPTDYPPPTEPYPDPGTPPPEPPSEPTTPTSPYPPEPPPPPDPSDYPPRPAPTYETPPIVVFPRDSGEPYPGPLPPTGTTIGTGTRPPAAPETP